ncbi:MAG: EAL domain-containing protein [Piscirickettsiaceae bacterium]|nr:EAL domain-containing protein [Piscirickettsiaceae bacterium]
MARAESILRLLLVDDSLTEADSITNTLRSTGHAVRASRIDNLQEIEQALTSQSWDLVLCRDSFSVVPPREVVNTLQRLGKDLPCIVLCSEKANMEQLYDVGVQDVVMMGDSQRLQFAVERELQNLFMRRLCRRNERALRESEKRSRLLLESSRDAVAYMHEGMHIYVNRAYIALFGYEEVEDIDGLPFLDMVTVDDHAKFKSVFRKFSENLEAKPQTVSVQCVKADGSGFRANIEFSHAQVEDENCTQVVIRDNDESSGTSDAQLQLLRDHDFLTGLYSRTRFMDELETVAGKAGEGQGDAALLYIVIDDFLHIKDKIGLGASELVIKDVAELLRKDTAEEDVIARYSDQVFTVIIASDDDNDVQARAETYRKIIDNYVSQVNQVDLQCSIGISRISERLSSAEAILDNADHACIQAQRAGGNQTARYQVDTIVQHAPNEGELAAWQQRLQKAIHYEGFCLFYQPIVSLHGEEQDLYETLIRLKDVDNEALLTPDNFIGYAEQCGLMNEIDEWVISHALDRLVEQHKTNPKTRFFIKLSKQTLCKTEFVDWLCASLNSSNIDGSSLVFEISETAAFENLEEAKSTISKLKNVGCEFGLEHFGSGLDFSQSLEVLDVDYLKINGAFVENMAKDAENQAAVKAIIEVTKQAGKSSIAEFVSDANSLALLWRLGVDYAQGYYIHEPSAELDYNFEDDEF